MSDTAPTGPDGDLARLIEILSRQVEASRRTAELLDSKALPLLERIAQALERPPTTPGSAVSAPGKSGLIAEFRSALDARRWEEAEAIARDLGRDHPDDPRGVAILDELERTRRFASDDLRDRIEAARQANDPDGAMAARDELARVLHGEPFKEVDRALVKWLMGLIQRRLRTGSVRPDVTDLASRVADKFAATTEGASLRASLPTLRRSAGLCPRCAEPYKGVADACPKCLAAAAASADPRPGPGPEAGPEADPDAELVGDPVDLNNESFWQAP